MAFPFFRAKLKKEKKKKGKKHFDDGLKKESADPK